METYGRTLKGPVQCFSKQVVKNLAKIRAVAFEKNVKTVQL